MEIIKSTNGFPYAWRAGRVEKLIRSILENKAQQQLSVDRVMFINPTWLHENDIGASIRDARPDFIICHNFVDPAVPKIFDAVEQSGIPHIMIGNADQFRLDFWAMVCDLYFQNYEEQDLEVEPSARKYICLNRKPHPHRVALVDALYNAGLQQQGFISLGLPGDGAITIDETFADEQGIRDEYGNLGVDETFVSRKIRNDIFSVGSLQVWNNSLLCLVTETEFANAYPENFFTSEKTFKPIIGMRPFFIYGQAPLRQYLKDSGFDIFDDVFDYTGIDELAHDPMRQQQYAQVAINAVNAVTNPQAEYRSKYFGRCQANKTQFRTYVYEQWNRLNNLDLTQYV
jgi:hypothetical protein